MKTDEEKREILTNALVEDWIISLVESCDGMRCAVEEWLIHGRVGYNDMSIRDLARLCADAELFDTLTEAEVYSWQVVEQAGFTNEELVSEWDSYDDAHSAMCELYTEFEREELHVDVLRNWSTEY